MVTVGILPGHRSSFIVPLGISKHHERDTSMLVQRHTESRTRSPITSFVFHFYPRATLSEKFPHESLIGTPITQESYPTCPLGP